jgi:hypothetical protein
MGPFFPFKFTFNSSSLWDHYLVNGNALLEGCMAITIDYLRNSSNVNQFFPLISSLEFFTLSLLFILYQSLVKNKALEL